MSTHILNDVERVCDRVAILNLGHLVVEGPIDELLDRYAQPIYELEPEPQQAGAIDRLAAAVRGQAWAQQVQAEPTGCASSSAIPRWRARDPAAGDQVGRAAGPFRASPAQPGGRLPAAGRSKGPAVAPAVRVPATGLNGRGRR